VRSLSLPCSARVRPLALGRPRRAISPLTPPPNLATRDKRARHARGSRIGSQLAGWRPQGCPHLAGLVPDVSRQTGIARRRPRLRAP
jgi:hypothetical protein